MNKHFSYLLDEQSDSFFQKVAMRQAEQVHRVRVPRPEPEPIEKQASAPSDFEKIAGRIDRDLYILKTAGPCGFNGGMTKRADAYIDVLLTNNNLSIEEFGEIFDKVAAESIEGDLQAAYEQACSQLPEDEHWIVEQTLAKVGHQMTEYALLEKQAIAAAAGRLLLGGAKRLGGLMSGAGTTAAKMRASAAGAKSIAGSRLTAAGKQIARPFKATARGGKALGREFRAGRRGAILGSEAELLKARQAARAISTAPGKAGEYARAAEKSLSKSIPEAQRKATDLLKANRPPKPPQVIVRRGGGAGAAPKGTAGPAKTTSETVTAKTQADTAKTQMETQRGAEKAREAAEGSVTPISSAPGYKPPKGTGTDGAARQPKPESTPKAMPNQEQALNIAKENNAPPGIIDKMMNQGISSLTTSEKVQAGLGAYMVGKTMFGD